MSTHILLNVTDDKEMRVAIVRDRRLEALIHERAQDEGQAHSNIYLGKVNNVEPSLDAAFVDLGTGKNGFIHVDELVHDKGSNKRIEQILKPGQEILVQITKESIRDKGPALSMDISLPGRCLVLMPFAAGGGGVSKRIEDQHVRRRLRKVLNSFDLPDEFGLIARTAAADRSDEELELDHAYLMRLWEEISQRAGRARAPACLYQEGDVVLRTLRDVVPLDVEQVLIDDEDAYDEARAFAQIFMPEIANRIALHRDEEPLFAAYGIEERLASVFDRQVELPSGGNVVIEQTEALVSIDVNSAKNKAGGDVEETAFITNMEAVNGIAEQLVLRDLGGLVIIDFIDMESREHQRLIQLALRRVLASDKARTHVAPMSRFGLVEMTRQRRRPSHKLVSYQECSHCRGTGVVKSAETFEIDCMRAIQRELGCQRLSRLEVVVPVDLVVSFMNARRHQIDDLEQRHDCKIAFVADSLMKTREFRLVPTVRKRQGKQNVKPVRPSLLAPMLEERVRAVAEAKELAQRSPAELEKELERIANGGSTSSIRVEKPAEPSQAVVASTTVIAAPVTMIQRAADLRSLLFTPSRPVVVSANSSVSSTSSQSNARPQSNSRSHQRRGRGRRR